MSGDDIGDGYGGYYDGGYGSGFGSGSSSGKSGGRKVGKSRAHDDDYYALSGSGKSGKSDIFCKGDKSGGSGD